MPTPIDDGSPLGGMALAFGGGAVTLVVLQLPASAVGVGWIPALLALAVAPLAIGLGGLALITEDSPRGRRNAKRGMALGGIVLLAEVAFVAVVGTLAGIDLRGLVL